MAYIIRILEMYICSAVPSALCVWILYKATNQIVWYIICFIALLVCIAANIWFWYDYIMHTNNDDAAFYSVNIVAFIAFMAGSVCLYKYTNAQLFSIIYAGMRSFEVFGMRTVHSVTLSFGILAVFMVLTKIFAVKLFGLQVSGEDFNALIMEEVEDESMTLYNIRKKKEQMTEEDNSDD